MVAYQDVFADEGNMRGLGRGQYLDTLEGAGAELQLLHMAMQEAYKQLQGPLSSQEEYDRAARIYYGYKNVSALLQKYIVDDVTRARLATTLGVGQQLSFDDINLLKDIDKKSTHPGLLVARHAIGGSLTEALLNLSLMRMARGWQVMASGGAGSTIDDLARVNKGSGLNNRKWGVDPSFRTEDEVAGVLVNGIYKTNPTAKNLSDNIDQYGKVRIDGKLADGNYMYVVDSQGNIIIGTRGRDPITGETLRMPHPTLIGGKDPTVSAAGMIDIRGGKIYSVNNNSGHFKPGNEALQQAQEAFKALPAGSFHKDFKGYVPY